MCGYYLINYNEVSKINTKKSEKRNSGTSKEKSKKEKHVVNLVKGRRTEVQVTRKVTVTG